MGTVGINFGAATGGTGFNVATTVASIVALSSAVENPWTAQLATLKTQDTALTTVGTHLAALSTAVSALTNFDGVLAAKEGSSSDTSVLTLTAASSAAVAGSHTVYVSKLASTSSTYTDELKGAGDVLSGSLTIQTGTAASTLGVQATAAQTIPIGSTNDTLTTLAQYINNGDYGVSASVVTDTNGARLSLVSNNSGAAGQIQLGGGLTDTTANVPLTGVAAVGFSVGQPGVDAVLSVDGLPTTSASNTVTNAIPGVTFQLLSSAPSEPIQVQVTNDNTTVETAVQTFVTAYNTVAADIKMQAGDDATGKPEPLYGDPTMSLIQSQLSQALFGGKASGAISSIDQMGITANPDGTLALNTSTLDAVLNSNYADVTGFFQNSGSWGQELSTALNTLGTASPTGAISLELAQNASVETGLNTNVTNENALIKTQTANLTTELNTANQELQAIPEQLSEVNEIYSAVTGYNQQH